MSRRYGGTAGENAGSGKYRGGKNNARPAPGSKKSNQRGSGGGSANMTADNPVLRLALAVAAIPAVVVLYVAGYVVCHAVT